MKFRDKGLDKNKLKTASEKFAAEIERQLKVMRTFWSCTQKAPFETKSNDAGANIPLFSFCPSFA